MNKNQFQTIFNQVRGLMIAVAEQVKSHTSRKRSDPNVSKLSFTNADATHTATIRPLVLLILFSLGMVAITPNPLNINTALAEGIVADQSAPANQRPVVLQSASGVPLVNIQTPSTAGVSRNTYSQFDVNNQGVILNNSRTNVQTQLAGFVQGNPYMAAGTARVILNEVNASNPSLLKGYVEVAGSRAQVVIANPAGISCSGCGFINANRVTLTTGTPLFNSGDLIGYRVTGGEIDFFGTGLDASQTNYTDIIARTVQVNAGIFANNLNMVSGTNQINVASNGDMTNIGLIASTDNNIPISALDVAALGGMYAGKIRLIGTEAGLGVNNAGTIGASVGEVSIDINGQLTNTGSIASTTETNLRATQITNTGGSIGAGQLLSVNAHGLTGDGKLSSGGDAALNLVNDYTHTGELQADGNLILTTTGNINNQAQILAGSNLSLNAATINNQKTIYANNNLTLNTTDINNSALADLSGRNTTINAAGTVNNRGLIDGSDTFINATTLNNIGTGSLFGDHVALKVTTLNNDAETVNAVNTAAVIAARSRLDIGAQHISNQNQSLLFSAGDIAIGGDIDTNHQATILASQSAANTLTNRHATIEALANINANIASLQNLNAGITTANVVTDITSYDQFTPRGTSVILNSADYPGAKIGNFNISWRSAGAYTFREYNRYLYTGTTSTTQILTTLPGQIQAGGNMAFNGNVTNSDSTIIAGGTLAITGGTLDNLNSTGTNTITYNGGTRYYYDYDGNESCGDPGDGCYDISAYAYNPAANVNTFNLPSTTLAQNSVLAGTGTTVAAQTTATLPTSVLFTTNPNPDASYLIETAPRFANYRTWLSSDYFLNALSLDPNVTQKRLGDGFYEQKLIREQIGMLTGKRFLANYSSDEAQYQALMQNGITYAQQFNLQPGIALSNAQVAQLTSDIVWLVQKEVTLADGSKTQALVPQVYVAVKSTDLNANGQLLAGASISASTINVNVTGDATNQGSLLGRQLVNINANNLQNLGGNIQSDVVLAKTTQDINNLGGSIHAQSSIQLEAAGDINIASTTQSSRNTEGASDFSRTHLDRVAGLYVNNPNGILIASAGNDLKLDAATLQNLGTDSQTQLKASNTIQLGTVTTAERTNSVGNSKNFQTRNTTQEVGSEVLVGGDLSLQAGNDIKLRAATLNSTDGDIQAKAGQQIEISEGRATMDFTEARHTKKSGTFTSKSSTRRDTFTQNTSIGSNVEANNISLVAGANIDANNTNTATANTNIGTTSLNNEPGSMTIQGSHVVATDQVNLNATGDIALISAVDTYTESHVRKDKKSGFSATSTSVGYGTSTLQTNSNINQTSNVASTVGSINGDVNINAGLDRKTGHYTQIGSDVLTPAGDINITAKNVDITAAQDTYQRVDKMRYKQTGITLAVTSPVISAIQTAQQMSEAASQTSDSRMQALAAATTALSAKNAYDAINTALSADPPGSGIEDAANQAGGVNLSLSIGTSKSNSTSTQTNTSAASSHLTAGGDINMTATGADTSKGATSDLNIIGSQVKANGDVRLSADNNLNLQAASNNSKLDSKNKNSSASIGISVGSNGFAVTASASAGKGQEKGNGTTWTETVIQSGNKSGDKVTLNSGAETNLIGAQVAGNQIIANVGTSGKGNLNIQSLQDTDQYTAQQKSAGFSVSVPIGGGAVGGGAVGGSVSASSSNTKSNYQSVQEQAGIFAGDGGFQINVSGKTDLKGAVIASTENAVQDNKNSLTTQTLAVSNIENLVKYDAKAASATLGGGLHAGLPQLSGAGLGSDNGKESSTTVSAISIGALNITQDSDELSKAAINRDVFVQADNNADLIAVNSQGNNLANTIKPIFDAEKVAKEIQAQVTITQAFNQQANEALGTYVQAKRQNLQQQLKAAATPEAKTAIQSQLNELRIEEQVMNVLVGAVGGMGGSAISKEGLSAAANEMRQLMIKDSVKFAGVIDMNGNTLDNLAAESVGVRLDGKKVGGTRVDLDLLCGAMNQRCAIQKNPDNTLILDQNGIPKLALTEKGQIVFNAQNTDDSSISLYDFIKTPEGHKMVGATGGIQGLIGSLFGKPYKADSWQDKLIESFSGTHDFIGGSLSGLYDEQGNIKRGMTDTERGIYNNLITTSAITVAAPFAVAELLPPEVWQAIAILLKGAK
jgi:filamentous hemagglutinin